MWYCGNYLFAIGRQYVLELPIVKHPYAALLSEENRPHPVFLGKALTFEDEIIVNLLSPFVVDSVPDDHEIRNNTGSIDLRYTKSKRKMVMKQTICLQSSTVGVGEIPNLKEIVRLLQTREQSGGY